MIVFAEGLITHNYSVNLAAARSLALRALGLLFISVWFGNTGWSVRIFSRAL